MARKVKEGKKTNNEIKAQDKVAAGVLSLITYNVSLLGIFLFLPQTLIEDKPEIKDKFLIRVAHTLIWALVLSFVLPLPVAFVFKVLISIAIPIGLQLLNKGIYKVNLLRICSLEPPILSIPYLSPIKTNNIKNYPSNSNQESLINQYNNNVQIKRGIKS